MKMKMKIVNRASQRSESKMNIAVNALILR